MRPWALAICCITLAARASLAHDDVRRLLSDATVRLASGCTGVIAERSQLIVTAEHCVRGRQSVQVKLAGGDRRTAWVVTADADADQALLFLEDPAPVRPLRITRRRPPAGTVLYFAGHPDRPRFQEGRLDRVGACPALPRLPNALFTSIHGRPGDSGAALVDAAGDIIGLVHGGVRCEIATPADTLLGLVHRVLFPSSQPAVGAAHAPAPTPSGAAAPARG